MGLQRTRWNINLSKLLGAISAIVSSIEMATLLTKSSQFTITDHLWFNAVHINIYVLECESGQSPMLLQTQRNVFFICITSVSVFVLSDPAKKHMSSTIWSSSQFVDLISNHLFDYLSNPTLISTINSFIQVVASFFGYVYAATIKIK